MGSSRGSGRRTSVSVSVPRRRSTTKRTPVPGLRGLADARREPHDASLRRHEAAILRELRGHRCRRLGPVAGEEHAPVRGHQRLALGRRRHRRQLPGPKGPTVWRRPRKWRSRARRPPAREGSWAATGRGPRARRWPRPGSASGRGGRERERSAVEVLESRGQRGSGMPRAPGARRWAPPARQDPRGRPRPVRPEGARGAVGESGGAVDAGSCLAVLGAGATRRADLRVTPGTSGSSYAPAVESGTTSGRNARTAQVTAATSASPPANSAGTGGRRRSGRKDDGGGGVGSCMVANRSRRRAADRRSVLRRRRARDRPSPRWGRSAPGPTLSRWPSPPAPPHPAPPPAPPDGSDRRALPAGAWMSVGLEFGVGVVLFFLLGGLLDDTWGTHPWMRVAGAGLGVVLGMYLLVRQALRSERPAKTPGGPRSSAPPGT